MAESIRESSFATWHCDQVGGNPYDEMAKPARLIVEASITHPRGIEGIKPVDIHMELDTGADMTTVPSELVSNMRLPRGFTLVRDCKGNVDLMKHYQVQLECSSLSFVGNIEAVARPRPRGLVGRDILNDRILILNGPAKCWCCPPKLCDGDGE